jgi:hypothetical protein
MIPILHTLTDPLGSGLEFVIDLGMTQTEYLAGVAKGEYPAIQDIPNWTAIMGDAPKPSIPLTTETIGALSFAHTRYITSGEIIGDALDDYMEARSPNLKRR